MDKFCEFCRQLRAVVYCKSDLAYLCLSCDTKVHSANALSSRHLRSLMCDSCRLEPTSLQCLNHRVFLCNECDRSLHEMCSLDRKREVRSYTGSPSAKDFAVLWGLRLDELHKRAADTQLCSTSAGPVATSFGFSGNSPRRTRGVSRVSEKKSCTALKNGAESDVISSSYLTKVSAKGAMKQETSFILQQIKDLGNLQLAEVDANGSVKPRPSPLWDTMKKFKNSCDQDFGSGLRSSSTTTIAPPDVKVDLQVSPFSFSESSPLTSIAANGLLGESIWQCKSPFQNSQLWSQTMQDLGICEDVCYDDLNIPDVDITFRNFEELFGGDQEPIIREMIDEKDASCSSLEKEMSLDKSINSIEMETSFASSVCGSHPRQLDKNREPLKQVEIGPSCSTMSFSVSHQSADSIATEDLDSAASPLCRSLEGDHLNSRQVSMLRYKGKKASQSTEKRIQYVPGKSKGDAARRRVKSRSTKIV